jgi:hypothetical protein
MSADNVLPFRPRDEEAIDPPAEELAKLEERIRLRQGAAARGHGCGQR